MRYIGGKAHIAAPLARFLAPKIAGRRLIEPFCGGLSMTVALQPAEASDISGPLIELILAIRAGWEPPEEISEADYFAVKAAGPSDPRYNFVGLCATWGGKWWGGYARPHVRQRNPVAAARASLLRKVESTRDVAFSQRSYIDISPTAGDAVYCDPPYRGTTAGYAAPPFDHDQFWDWARSAVGRGALVYVSEFSGPHDAEIVFEIKRRGNVRAAGFNGEATDRIFEVRGPRRRRMMKAGA